MEQTEKRKNSSGEPENTRPEPESRAEKTEPGQDAAQASSGQPEEKKNPEDALEKELLETRDLLAKQKDQLLRTAAEYENYRKRTEREKTMVYADATAAAVLEFLPVADNLERALEQEDCGSGEMHKGIEMVQKQMSDALAKLGVTEMGKEGDAFDPALHNAVSHVEDESAGENSVVKVFQKGYRIGDRIVRHAMVQVAN